jgi:prophage regulatory protein
MAEEIQAEFVRVYPDRLLRAREVTEMLGISRSSFYSLLKTGQFEPPVRITAARVGWPLSVVKAFIQTRPKASRVNG